jgi:hypothetical protein
MVRRNRPDGRMSATSNFHIRLLASGPRGMAIQTVDLQYAISISVVRASGLLKLNPQFPYQMHARSNDGKLPSERLNLNCDSCHKEKRVRTGIHVVRKVASIFPYLNFGKKI